MPRPAFALQWRGGSRWALILFIAAHKQTNKVAAYLDFNGLVKMFKQIHLAELVVQRQSLSSSAFLSAAATTAATASQEWQKAVVLGTSVPHDRTKRPKLKQGVGG